MLSTIRTIFTFNKNLTLGLPSALTWVFLYNHEGPCGVILCSLETMIIKKHLLSDFFFSIWLSLPLWSLSPLGCATGLSISFCIITEFLCSSGEPQHTAAQLSPTVMLGMLGLFAGREAAQPMIQSLGLAMCLLAVCMLLAGCHLGFPCCKVNNNIYLESALWGFNRVVLITAQRWRICQNLEKKSESVAVFPPPMQRVIKRKSWVRLSCQHLDIYTVILNVHS